MALIDVLFGQTLNIDIFFPGILPQEVLPKSHLHGALQRVLGRDVYKSETPFFYRRDG